jgi:Flp pilus assembly protein TadB
MTFATLIAAAGVAVAAGALVPAPLRGDGPSAPRVRLENDQGSPLRRVRPLLVALVALGVWALVGGLGGTLAGAAAAAWAWRVLGATESPAVARRREEVAASLPLAVHLLAACLRAGSAIGPALGLVGDAIGGAVAEDLGALAARLRLGTDPRAVWSEVAAGGPLAPLGAALLRSHDSGASVTAVVERLCIDLRAGVRTRAMARARTVEVRAAAPLGVCLLPAFLLLGIVPLTAGVFSGFDLLG